MTQNADTQPLLYQVRLLLDEERSAEALSILQNICIECALREEIAYLTGWCLIQMQQWEPGIQVLRPLLAELNPPAEEAAMPERERSSFCLLYLGLAAMSLARYEDAALHLTHCLKVLHDRRVHLPSVRIRVRSALAHTCAIRGLHVTAVQHYEEALRFCQHYNDSRELPAIYYGLCDAYCHIDDFAEADVAGLEALRLYRERSDYHMQARTLHLLGCMCRMQGNYAAAADYYSHSLHLACEHRQQPIMLMNYIALADLYVVEKRLEEARHYCETALQALGQEESGEACQCGEMYRVAGKVAQEQARCAMGAERNVLLEEAVMWYEKAVQRTVEARETSQAAEIYERLARVLEELGRPQEALKRWHSAYTLQLTQGLGVCKGSLGGTCRPKGGY